MEFITENYVIIIIVGSFLVFALIGYLIDMFRNVEKKEEDKVLSVKPIDIVNIEEKLDSNDEEKEESDNPDELLENYENE